MNNSDSGFLVTFDVYGFLMGLLFERFEKKELFKDETLPQFLHQKLQEYLPTNPGKNSELKKPLYIAFLESEIKSLEDIVKVIGIKAAVQCAARSKFFYSKFRASAKKENVTIGRVCMKFKITNNNDRLIDPEPEIIVSAISENPNYELTVTILDWKTPKSFKNLLIS